MTAATAVRVRPGKAAQRAWYAALDSEDKSTARKNVESMMAEGVSQSDAWDRVHDSSQQPVVDDALVDAISDALVEPDVASTPGDAIGRMDDLVRAEQPKSGRAIATKGGKLPEHLRTALDGLKSSVADDGTLTIVRGEQQRVVDRLRAYADNDRLPLKDHVVWTIESVIGSVRAVFTSTTDSGENVNVRAIDALRAQGRQFEVVMRSDGSPTYKVGDDTISAREVLKRFGVQS